jgi:hypothetical protein
MSFARPFLTASLLCLTAGSAHAQVVILRSAGQTIEPLGLVPVASRDAVRTLTSLGAVQVGFVYDYDALYSVKVWASSGKYCLFMDQQYWVISREEAARFLGAPSVDPPWAYRFPPGLIALWVGGIVVLLFGRFGGRWASALEKRFPARSDD